MHPFRILKTLVAGTACLALAACDLPGAGQPPPASPQRVAPAPITPKSAASSAYYTQVQQMLLSQGLMRTDPGTNIPYTDRMLAENFMRIALYDEYRRGNGGFVREETASRLRRWEEPVRIGVRFGASVPPVRIHPPPAPAAPPS